MWDKLKSWIHPSPYKNRNANKIVEIISAHIISSSVNHADMICTIEKIESGSPKKLQVALLFWILYLSEFNEIMINHKLDSNEQYGALAFKYFIEKGIDFFSTIIPFKMAEQEISIKGELGDYVLKRLTAFSRLPLAMADKMSSKYRTESTLTWTMYDSFDICEAALDPVTFASVSNMWLSSYKDTARLFINAMKKVSEFNELI